MVDRPVRTGQASGSILNISIIFTKEEMKKQNRVGDVAQCSTDEKSLLCRGCSSVVERPFRIGKASGSIPDISNFFHKRGNEKARSWVNENSLSGRVCSSVKTCYRVGDVAQW